MDGNSMVRHHWILLPPVCLNCLWDIGWWVPTLVSVHTDFPSTSNFYAICILVLRKLSMCKTIGNFGEIGVRYCFFSILLHYFGLIFALHVCWHHEVTEQYFIYVTSYTLLNVTVFKLSSLLFCFWQNVTHMHLKVSQVVSFVQLNR